MAAAAASAAAAAAYLLTGSSPAGRLVPAAGSVSPRRWRGGAQTWESRRLGRLPLSGLLLTGASLAAVSCVGLVPAAVAMATAYVLLRRSRSARLVRRGRQQHEEDVRVLRALAAELRSGLPPRAALRAAALGSSPAAGLRARLRAAAAADALGGDVTEVMVRGSEPGSPGASLAAAWEVCRLTGGRLAGPVSRIADGAAGDLRVSREAESGLASARSSARLLAALPIAGALLGTLSGTGSLSVLLFSQVGQLCLVAGVTLDLMGLAWLDRLARSAGV